MMSYGVLVFIAGTIIGSFLNVAAYRLPRGESLLFPGSHCPHCGHSIPFYYNIPLISFLMLKGRCAYCGHKISPLYPLLELTSGVLAWLLWRHLGFTPQFFYYWFLFSSFLLIAVIDFKTHLILNSILITDVLFWVVFNLMWPLPHWKDKLLAFLGIGLLFYLIAQLSYRIFKKEALGMGDVKLAAVFALTMGWRTTLLGMYLGFVIALFGYIVGVMVSGKRDFRIPMAPFFSSGVFLMLFFEDALIQKYLEWIGI